MVFNCYREEFLLNQPLNIPIFSDALMIETVYKYNSTYVALSEGICIELTVPHVLKFLSTWEENVEIIHSIFMKFPNNIAQ